jgi:hypothetical protein
VTKYLITRTVQYTECLEVEAETAQEAKEKAQYEEFERNHDDMICDEVVYSV